MASPQVQVGSQLGGLLKDGYTQLSGLEMAMMKNIEACQELGKLCRTSTGPNGMHKMARCLNTYPRARARPAVWPCTAVVVRSKVLLLPECLASVLQLWLRTAPQCSRCPLSLSSPAAWTRCLRPAACDPLRVDACCYLERRP